MTFPSAKKEKAQFIADHPEIAWDAVQPDKSGSYGKTQVNALIRHYQESYRFDDDSLEAKVKRVAAMLEEEKQLSCDVAEMRKVLIDKTIETIQTLDNDVAIELLRQKWIQPLINSLQRMPDEVIAQLTERVQRLASKYATTYQDIALRINKAESRLYDLIGQLQGSDADNIGLAVFQKTLNVK